MEYCIQLSRMFKVFFNRLLGCLFNGGTSSTFIVCSSELQIICLYIYYFTQCKVLHITILHLLSDSLYIVPGYSLYFQSILIWMMLIYVIMFYITGVINCISASSDGQVMCSTAEDKSLKVFDVVNFGTLTMFLPSATNIISLAGTTCSKGG